MSLKDFVILQKLGSGSFASVYKARRLIDQQIYALKKIDLKALGTKQKNNALNEIRLLACLSSPYIIGYCQSFFDEKLDILAIAMEYANEGDLLKKIQKQKKLRSLIPEVQVWKIFIHLLYGLNELHSKNILHRDLKAENIFIGNGIYKIGDMNVSKIIKNGLACTQTGTPYYASPEVWNDQPYNEKSDIWSLGCILYEVAALRPPYEASSMQKLFDMVTRSSTPKIPTNYSRELQMIIDSCLQKNPVNRPSAKELLSNHTLKIYQNLLIQFKPQIGDAKGSLLKTIYMPNSKKELKKQLPQSNYKSSQEKNNQKEEDQAKSTKKQGDKISKRDNQATLMLKVQTRSPSQIKHALINIDNLIHQNGSSKIMEHSKHRNRIQSCQIFKDLSSKKINSKQNLIARADFIIESQKKPHQEKKNIQGAHSAIFLNKFQKNTSQKQMRVKDSLPSNKCLNSQIYIRDEEIIFPKKLIFDELASQKVIQILKDSVQQAGKDKNDHTGQISNQPYLLDILKNVSIISQKNHSHYKFGTEQDMKKQVSEQNLLIDKENIQLKLQEPISQKISQSNQILLPNLINILIDINENQQLIKPFQEISSEKKMSFMLGFQKLKNQTQNIFFKNKISAFTLLKNQFIRFKIMAREEELKLRLHHQNRKEIKETLQVPLKVIHQNTPSKTFQKRNRSKSIRKTQKCKPFSSEANENTNLALIDKINKKISIESTEKVEMKAESIKKEYRNKKIFDKQNKLTQDHFENTYHQKLKQMALVPKNIGSSGNKASSKEKKKNQQNHSNTSQKAKNMALKVLESNSIIPHHGSDRKFIPQGINSYQQKKKKIFENSNPVHNASDKIDRINLEKKMKKYINF